MGMALAVDEGSRGHAYFPILLNIHGKKCVIVGGGPVALRRTKALLECGAIIRIISPSLCSELARLAVGKKITVMSKNYEAEDLLGAFLVIAATDDTETNRKVAKEARKQKVLVNVVDNSRESDFIVPAQLRRGDLTIAVSTGGKSPALSRRIRTSLEKHIGPEYADIVSLVAEVRSGLKDKAARPDGDDWQSALDLDWLSEMLRAGQREQAKAALLNRLGRNKTGKGIKE
jgi:siroheme synthase-like protein